MSTQRTRYPVEIFDPAEALREAKELHAAHLEGLRAPPVSQGEFARQADIDRRQVQDFIQRGILHPDKNGQLNVMHNMRRYISYLRGHDLDTVT